MNLATRCRRIIAEVYSTPWAIQPQRLIDIMEVLSLQASGEGLTPDEVQAYLNVEAASRPRVMSAGNGTVAVVGLRGILSHRIEMMDDLSGPGGTSMEGFRSRFRAAMGQDEFGAVVIDADSPGGSVDGIAEMAQEIFEARGAKPIIAVANTLAGSAAYYLASQADELVVTPSGEVGSIGVFAAHSDLSEKMALAGEKVTLIHAGTHKVEGNPFEPLGEEARAHFQSLVDGHYKEFVDAVARGRGKSTATVEADFGQGRSFRAEEAVKRGMADRVETLEQAIGRLRSSKRSTKRAEVPRSPASFQFWPSSGA